MLYLAHRDMTMHADGLTRLSKTYEKVMIVRTPEMEVLLIELRSASLFVVL